VHARECVCAYVRQVLQRLSVRATNGPDKLLKVCVHVRVRARARAPGCVCVYVQQVLQRLSVHATTVGPSIKLLKVCGGVHVHVRVRAHVCVCMRVSVCIVCAPGAAKVERVRQHRAR